MKRIFFCLTILLISRVNTRAQVGIGTSAPNASSMLDVTSTSKGVLFPSYSLIDLTDNVNPINNPADGLLIYNTGGTYAKGFYYWYVDSWKRLFVMDDVPRTMVLSTKANTSTGLTPFLNSATASGNKFSTFGLVGTTIPNSAYNATNSTITLPKGKYKLEFSTDVVYDSGLTTVPITQAIGSSAQQLYYFSFNTYLKDTSGNVLGNVSYDNEVISGTFATYYTCFYIDLSASTTFSFYIDWASDSQKAAIRPRASADFNIFELKDF